MDRAVKARYVYVDLLRGLAATAVLIGHYRWFFARFPGDWRTDVALPGYAVLWPVYEHSEVAVPLFWILSGFVFAIAYGRHGKGLSLRDFWLRRFSRLYPLHFLTLIAVAALQAVSMALYGQWTVVDHNDLPHFILHLFFASNWFTLQTSFNAPIWSVSIEELVYFAFLLYLKRLGLSLPGALALGLAGFILARLTLNQVALCLAMFFAGVAIAILAPRIGRWLLTIAAAGLAATALLLLLDHGGHVLGILIYAGAPSLLVLAIGLDARAPPLPRSLRWIGLSTYSIYLLHMPLLIALKMSVGVVPLWLFAGLVLGLAVPCYRFVEAPAQRAIRARFLPRAAPCGAPDRPLDRHSRPSDVGSSNISALEGPDVPREKARDFRA